MAPSGSPAAGTSSSPSGCCPAYTGGSFWTDWPSRTKSGTLQFFGDHTELVDRAVFDAFLQPLRKIDWVVYAKEPFARPKAVLGYLSRYTRTA